ncbi:MAG: SRPBCC domain-containing protein, partial [Bacteroidota bacterium]
MIKSVKKEKHYGHSIQDVWNAITDEKQMASWFIQADFKAEKGYQYTFTHQETKIRGTVLEANPVYLLVYTWDVNNSGVETKVKWSLSEKDGGTLL